MDDEIEVNYDELRRRFCNKEPPGLKNRPLSPKKASNQGSIIRLVMQVVLTCKL